MLETTIQYSQKFVKTEHFLAENQHLCDRVVRAALDFYGVDPSELDEHIKQAEKDNKLADKVSVSQSLKHIVRDWSEEGLSERGDAFPCLLDTMNGLFPERGSAGEEVKVLLPGAGLGRLGHEVASLGGKASEYSHLGPLDRMTCTAWLTAMKSPLQQDSKLLATSGPCT